jgi:hypothetical protein
VVLGMLLRRMLVVLARMHGMTVRRVRVMRGFFVISGLSVFGGFAVMPCRVIVMLGGLLKMFVNLVTVHCSLSH